MGTVIGWDMTAALAMGTALGLPPLLVAEWLPEIEPLMVRAANRRADDDPDPASQDPDHG
jgi:hypothetical protein